ncbi:MAG: hypothetical protein ACFFFH_06800 [Candidatus Thorarchaeota archaeon]
MNKPPFKHYKSDHQTKGQYNQLPWSSWIGIVERIKEYQRLSTVEIFRSL